MLVGIRTRPMTNSGTVKKRLVQYGADICGVAPVTRFVDAPEGFHPCDIYPDCRSVVVFAARFPLSTLHARTNAPYTLVRNRMVEKVDSTSFHVSDELEAKGVTSIPIPSAEPYDYWDGSRSHGRGILSLKHAGVLASLGVLGKNTLLMNENFGNMIWLGALLVPVDLEVDPIASYEGYDSACTLCLDSCPQHALDGVTVNQKLCRERSISYNYGGGWVLSCNTCRKLCPYYNGLPKRQRKDESAKT